MSGRFPNVDWWCDYCGALLNYQNGFDDSNDTLGLHGMRHN